MTGMGVSRDYSRHRTCSGKKTSKGCTVQENLDNIVLIDVDSDGFDNVIIIDVPESLQQKLRGPGVLRKGKRYSFPGIICIDDDESDNAEFPESNSESGGDVDSDGTSSSSCPFASDNMCNCVDADANGCRLINKERLAFKLSKCQRHSPTETSSGNYNRLDSESDSDASQSDFSDCEFMEGSFGELSEHWKKARLKRNSDVNKAQSGPKSQSTHSSTDHNFDVQKKTKQHGEAPVISSSNNSNFERVNSSSATATGDQTVGADSFIPPMENPFNSCKADQESDVQCQPTRTCFHSSEENIMGDHSFLNSELRHDVHSAGEKVSFQDEDVFLYKFHCSSVMHNIHRRRVVSKETVEEFTCPTFSSDNGSNKAQFKSASSVEKGKAVSGEKLASDVPSSEYTVVRNSMDDVRTVPEESFRTPSWGEPIFTHEKAGQQFVEKINSGERSFCGSQCHEALSKPGTSTLPERNESSTDATPNIKKCDERDSVCSSPTDSVLDIQRDIINEREELKKTDEYKQAVEEEWAARQLQLKLQAEEAQRLRRRRKAECLRILDMQKRQKQRVEEVRATQKMDEENLSMKERLRGEVIKELHRLEMTCFDMASLLRGLGIHVGGGFYPLMPEVQAAYKRALLKFHPDRASRTDIRQQVEAEEKFKLISRMKEKFLSSRL